MSQIQLLYRNKAESVAGRAIEVNQRLNVAHNKLTIFDIVIGKIDLATGVYY